MQTFLNAKTLLETCCVMDKEEHKGLYRKRVPKASLVAGRATGGGDGEFQSEMFTGCVNCAWMSRK